MQARPCHETYSLFSFEGVVNNLTVLAKANSLVGVSNNEGPPVPIPNTEVKLIRADNT